MKIAVLSGKGGTGKTFVSVNLAASSNRSSYVDCDVEEPNGRLFLKPAEAEDTPVYTLLPSVDPDKCNGCRKCVDFCRFSALAFVQNKPLVFPEICHACGGCAMVCPTGAITEVKREVGIVSQGMFEGVRVTTGILNTGEASAVPVIKAALQAGDDNNMVIDAPPGSGCSVMETITGADYCLLVAEPTAFGFHNFKIVHQLVTLLHKPFGVIINKADTAYAPLEDFCSANNVPILTRILYNRKLAEIGARGDIAVRKSGEFAVLFAGLWDIIQKEAAS